jgi:type IV secretion system protein VirD4
MKNYAGHRLSPWLGHLMVSRQETARPLLTPGEVMQLPPSDEIILVSGLPPIRAKKARYYEDPRLTARILPPPELERIDHDATPYAASNRDTEDDWCGLMARHEKPAAEESVSAAPSDDEDPANGGIRREPELPEHEAIAPEEPILAAAPENFIADESDDDEATKARVLRGQARSLARQASMDPDDGIAL